MASSPAASDMPSHSAPTDHACGSNFCAAPACSTSSAPLTEDEVLRQFWEGQGQLDLYDAPGEQELAELANPRRLGRGREKQRKRIKANRQLH